MRTFAWESGSKLKVNPLFEIRNYVSHAIKNTY